MKLAKIIGRKNAYFFFFFLIRQIQGIFRQMSF